MSLDLSVVIPTHNPDPSRLARVVAALRSQTLAAGSWEIVLVDNGSNTAPIFDDPPRNFRLVHEPQLGLTHARRAGLQATAAPLVVLVDDDNVLAPEYLTEVARLFAAHPRVGALGGRITGEFERPPDPWHHEFLALLALRDHGSEPKLSRGLRPGGVSRKVFPAFAPVGAGMALRRKAAAAWLAGTPALQDREGESLSSAGDNELVFSVMAAGWEVGYFPSLMLTHLIPANRLEPRYLARLNRGIQESWMRVLTRYDANPWPPIAAWTVPLRQAKAWWNCRAWSGPAANVRWAGACGHFAGRTITRRNMNGASPL